MSGLAAITGRSSSRPMACSPRCTASWCVPCIGLGLILGLGLGSMSGLAAITGRSSSRPMAWTPRCTASWCVTPPLYRYIFRSDFRFRFRVYVWSCSHHAGFACKHCFPPGGLLQHREVTRPMAGHDLMNSKLVRLGSSTSAPAIDILWLCHALLWSAASFQDGVAAELLGLSSSNLVSPEDRCLAGPAAAARVQDPLPRGEGRPRLHHHSCLPAASPVQACYQLAALAAEVLV